MGAASARGIAEEASDLSRQARLARLMVVAFGTTLATQRPTFPFPRAVLLSSFSCCGTLCRLAFLVRQQGALTVSSSTQGQGAASHPADQRRPGHKGEIPGA